MSSPRLRRLLVAVAPLLVVLGALPATAAAAAAFAPCANHRSFECATVDVPLDRSGGVAGTVPLHVERQIGTGGRSTAYIGLAGGPGQSAASLAQDTWLELGAPVAGVDQIVTFDQRGTGKSGLLDCATAFSRARSQTEATALCGEKVGNMRPFFTTSDSVADLEAVRQAIGADKVVLVGVSYGTYVALRYARAFPSRVAALVLDSTVPLSGVDQWNGPTYAAVPGMLQRLCTAGACPFTRDPVGDMRTVATRLAKRRAGTFVSASGKRSSKYIQDGALLFSLLLDGDFNPQLRAYLPGAMSSARAGDWAPLVRLVGLDYGDGNAEIRPDAPHAGEDQAEDSDGVFLATTCTDSLLPWAPPSAPTSRGPGLKAAADALDLNAFRPFDRNTVLATSSGARCFSWPATAAQAYADSGEPLPVPTLLLSGGADLRTPTADAVRTQGILPGATIVTVGGVGHYVLGNDPTGCARTAYARFLTGEAVADPCAGVDVTPTTLPRPPLRLSSVPTLGGKGTGGRIARVAARTMVDALASSGLPARIGSTVRLGGLRGGRIAATFSAGRQRVTLSRVEYLRGIEVSGTVTSTASALRATLKVDGGRAARRGTIKIVDNRLTGKIGGRRISSVDGKRSAHAARSDLDELTGLRFAGPGVDIG